MPQQASQNAEVHAGVEGSLRPGMTKLVGSDASLAEPRPQAGAPAVRAATARQKHPPMLMRLSGQDCLGGRRQVDGARLGGPAAHFVPAEDADAGIEANLRPFQVDCFTRPAADFHNEGQDSAGLFALDGGDGPGQHCQVYVSRVFQGFRQPGPVGRFSEPFAVNCEVADPASVADHMADGLGSQTVSAEACSEAGQGLVVQPGQLRLTFVAVPAIQHFGMPATRMFFDPQRNKFANEPGLTLGVRRPGEFNQLAISQFAVRPQVISVPRHLTVVVAAFVSLQTGVAGHGGRVQTPAQKGKVSDD